MDREAPFTERFRIRVEAGWSGFAEALPPILDTARRGDTDGLGYAVAPSRQGRWERFFSSVRGS